MAIRRRPKQKKFFEELGKCLKIQVALKKADIPKRTFYLWMREDKWFIRQYKRFVDQAVMDVETRGLSLAARGSKVKSFNKDIGFYTNRHYSPELIKFFLRSHKPSLYGLKMGLNIDLNQAVQIVLPHNGRDEKNIAKAKEPCGAKIEKAAKS